EAATAERYHESTTILEAFGIDLPFPPRKKIIGKRKGIDIFIFEHHCGLIGVPSMFGCQDGRAQHIQEAVHLCLDFLSVLAQRMMETGRKLDRQLMRSRSYQRLGNLHRSRKRICSYSAGTQFVTESR